MVKQLIFFTLIVFKYNVYCQGDYICSSNKIDSIIKSTNDKLSGNLKLKCFDYIKNKLTDEIEQVRNMDDYLSNGDENSLDYYKENFSKIMGKCSTLNCVIDSFYDKAENYMSALVNREFRYIFDYAILEENAKEKKRPLLSFYYQRNKYDFFDFNAKVLNYSKKRIKYVWLTVKVLNPVGDVIPKSVFEKYHTLELIGFINSYESGKYKFDNFVLDVPLDDVKISKMKVQYEDGSIVEYTKESDFFLPDSYLNASCF